MGIIISIRRSVAMPIAYISIIQNAPPHTLVNVRTIWVIDDCKLSRRAFCSRVMMGRVKKVMTDQANVVGVIIERLLMGLQIIFEMR
jgi:hypothetical protein